MDVFKVVRSAEATQNLEDITFYIAEDNPYQALAFIEKLINTAESTLAVFPEKHPKYKNCHMWPYQDYLIFFDIEKKTKTVEILMITHASQYSKYKHFIT